MKSVIRTGSLKHLLTVAVLATAWPAAGWAQNQSAVPPALQEMEAWLGIMLRFYEVVDETHDMAANPEKAAIFQMHKIKEVYEERGEKSKAIDVLRGVIKDTSNPAIRAAAYIMLGDLLKETGRADEALTALQTALDESLRNAK